MQSFSTSYAESTVTELYQTTIPELVCKVLGLNKYDKISYRIQPNGQVLLSRAEQAESGTILQSFLSLLAQDMAENPHSQHILNAEQISRVKSLISETEFDLDTQLLDMDEEF